MKWQNSTARELFQLGMILAFILSGCSASATPTPGPVPESVRFALQSVIFGKILGLQTRHCPPAQEILIYSRTVTYFGGWEQLSERFPTLERDTLDDYNAMNSSEHPLNPHLNIGCLFTFVDSPSYYDFSNPFPGMTIYSFSNIGFNATYTQALVYGEYDCGPECAGGTIYLLEYEGIDWVIIDRIGTFNS